VNKSRLLLFSAILSGALLIALIGAPHKSASEKEKDFRKNFSISAKTPCYQCRIDRIDKRTMEKIRNHYKHKEYLSNYSKAEAEHMLGIINQNQKRVCNSVKFYEKSIEEVENPKLIHETLVMLSDDCKVEDKHWEKAIELNKGWRRKFFKDLREGKLERRIKQYELETGLEVPKGTEKIIIGRSRINLSNSTTLGAQTHRVISDWASERLDTYHSKDPDNRRLQDYHEGLRTKKLERYINDTESLTGTIVLRSGDEWYAPDKKGNFMFEVLPDKVRFPTTKCHGNICMIVETHGISALVDQSIKSESNLVLGCGDTRAKMKAAHYLAERGVDVHFPADRFISKIVGHETEGTMLGTAPVKDGYIGGQEIAIDSGAEIYVQDTDTSYPTQYYDAPRRYFQRLKSEGVPIKVNPISIDDLKSPKQFIEKAESKGAQVIGIRIRNKQERERLSKWLEDDKEHRAVLFHSTLYGYSADLFQEFPNQTSFGDPQPVFKN
jgi:hypothetical protein